MKKLKIRLKRRICDVLSSTVLWCDGKGYFKRSTLYRTCLNDKYFADILKYSEFCYKTYLYKANEGCIVEAHLTYDLFRLDVPFQKAYNEKLVIHSEYDNIPSLKELYKEIKPSTWNGLNQEWTENRELVNILLDKFLVPYNPDSMFISSTLQIHVDMSYDLSGSSNYIIDIVEGEMAIVRVELRINRKGSYKVLEIESGGLSVKMRVLEKIKKER